MLSRAPQTGSELRSKIPLYLGFAATGVALTLPGALLPVLLRRWQMGDSRGGLLLFCFFAATSLGALCSRGSMNRSVARGSALAAAGAVGFIGGGPVVAFAAIFVHGLGLGIAMTSVSLLLSRRYPNARRLEMTRLNLVWALGAAMGPWLALHSPKIEPVLMGLAGFFLVFGVWVWFETDEVVAEGARPGKLWALRDIPLPLLVLGFAATGIEASAGGWLTTLAQRNSETLRTTIGAATLLWLGLLACRLLHSTPWVARWNERRVLVSSVWTIFAALALLIAWPAGVATMVAAAMLGFGLGPVYPLVIGAVLQRKEHGTIFVVAGLGSSTLPLLTGGVSAWTHSLRSGLGVPLLAAGAMVAMATAWLRTKDDVQGEASSA
jgi:FHS family glucose/mannose:H+ symporter-like MFS transporter